MSRTSFKESRRPPRPASAEVQPPLADPNNDLDPDLDLDSGARPEASPNGEPGLDSGLTSAFEPVASAPPTLFSSFLAVPAVQYQAGALLVVSWLLGEARLFRLCLLIVCMVGAVRLWSFLSLKRVDATVGVDAKRLFCGGVVGVQMTLRNVKILPVWLKASLPATDGFDLQKNLSGPGPGDRGQQQAGLAAFGEATLEWRLLARRRGVYHLGPFTIEAGDPLGFHSRRRHVAGDGVIVYPRLVPVTPVALKRCEEIGRPGAGRLQDMTYSRGLQAYTPGRPARHIDWRATARLGQLVERVGAPTAQARVLLVVCAERFDEDVSGDRWERCLEGVASLAVEFSRLKCAVGLVTNGRLAGEVSPVVRASRHPGALARILEVTARLQPTLDGDLSALLKGRGVCSAASTALVFGYGCDVGLATLARQLSNRCGAVRTVDCGGGPGQTHLMASPLGPQPHVGHLPLQAWVAIEPPGPEPVIQPLADTRVGAIAS